MTRSVRHLVCGAAALALTAGATVWPGAMAQADSSTHVGPDVTGGSPDGSRHPYVAMVVAPGATKPSCTAVLVSADNGRSVVLSDAHCLYHGQHSGSGVGLSFAADLTSSTTLARGSFTIDPAYDPATHLHDVAVLTVATTNAPSPATLAPLGAGSSASGTYVDTVGTGQPYEGHRRTATEYVTRTSTDWLYLRAGSGNSCDGDSGGPDLERGTATVLALTDQGTCSYDEDTRLDTVAERVFVDRAAGLSGTRSTVESGSHGSDVRVVQSLLGATPDGSFGPHTQAVVVAWQKAHGLSADGVVGPLTWASLGW